MSERGKQNDWTGRENEHNEQTKLHREFEREREMERERENRREEGNCRKGGSLVRHYPQSNPQFQVRRNTERDYRKKRETNKDGAT